MVKKSKINICFFKSEIFCEKHRPISHIKYKKIDCAPSKNSFLANKFASANSEQFIRRIKSPLTR